MRRLAAFLTLLLLAGCSRHPRSPEDAYRRLCQAVNGGDAAALFATLDQSTRWAWMTVQRCHREAYDIVLSNYPQGPVRERELRRFEAGATSETAADLFGREAGPSALRSLAPLVAAGAPVETHGGQAEVVLAGAQRLALAEGDDGSWGYAGLAADAKDRERRAIHDLELVRTSAADYERAAARSGK
jgi:hypothetical protein